MAETGDYTGDFSELTPIQKQNLLAYRVRKLQTKQAFGNKIKLVTPESEILEEDRPMAIPLADLDSKKQVLMKFAEVTEYPDGSTELVHDRESQPIPDNAEDVLVALQRTLDTYEKTKSAAEAKKRREAASYKVPKGFKLVPIDDEEPAELPESLQVQDQLGVVVDSTNVSKDVNKAKSKSKKEAAKTEVNSREDNIKQLLAALLNG